MNKQIEINKQPDRRGQSNKQTNINEQSERGLEKEG